MNAKRKPSYPLTLEDVEEIFTLQKPPEGSAEHFDACAEATRNLARAIMEHTPSGPGQTIALRKLAETRMAINSAIIFEGAW